MIQSFLREDFIGLEGKLDGLNNLAKEALSLQGRTRDQDYLIRLPHNPHFRELLVAESEPTPGNVAELKGYETLLRHLVPYKSGVVVIDIADEIIIAPKHEGNGVARNLMLTSLGPDRQGFFSPLLLRASLPQPIARYHRTGEVFEAQHGIPYDCVEVWAKTHQKKYSVFGYGLDRLPVHQRDAFPLLAQYAADLPPKMHDIKK